LIAAAVAVSASAGVNMKFNQLQKNTKSQVSLKEMKAAKATRPMARILKNSNETFTATPLNAMDWQVRPSKPMLRAGEGYKWDFEDEAQLNDWMTLDNDGDGFGWEYFNNTGLESGRFTAYSGEGLMISASYDKDSGIALTPDNWLISPVVTLGKTAALWACGQDPDWAGEKFAIYVCVGNPTNINDFVKVSDDFTATGTYKQYGADLSAYEGQQGCIAIRHYNVTDMFYLNIDDVEIGDIELEPQPENPVITEIPEGCKLYTFMRNSSVIAYSFLGFQMGYTDGTMTLAIDEENGDAYIQNIAYWYDNTGAWVKGTYDAATGIITIPTGQYLAWYDDYGYGIQLYMGYTDVEDSGEVDEEGNPTYSFLSGIDERTTEFELKFENGKLYLLGTEGNIAAEFPNNYVATGLMAVYDDDLSFTSIEFANYNADGMLLAFGATPVEGPAVPAKPVCDEWYDCGDESGFSRLYYTLPKQDVNGDMLNPENLSYSIFVDNGDGPELFTFPAVDYTHDLTEDITEVPYELYSSAVDFRSTYTYFYRTTADGYEPLFTKNIGIQVYYTADGVKNASEIAWLYEQEEPVEPEIPTEGYYIVFIHNDGTKEYVELQQGMNGDYVDVFDLTYPTYHYNCPFYFLIDGVAYGAGENATQAVLGDADQNPLSEDNDNTYIVPVGYSYTLGIHFIYDQETLEFMGYSAYVAKGGQVEVEELNADKAVAGVRYFNVVGQEMAQPSGLTIQVTTYTDGTTSTVKVVK